MKNGVINEWWLCPGCEKKLRWGHLKSRCLMQLQSNKWNGHCSTCCCLNSRRNRPCDDPTGLGWVRE